MRVKPRLLSGSLLFRMLRTTLAIKVNMKERITRRAFVGAAGIGALANPSLLALAQVPQVLSKGSTKPVVIAASNGNKSKDTEGLTCVAKAYKMLTAGREVHPGCGAGGA